MTLRAAAFAVAMAILASAGVASAQPKRFREGEVAKPHTSRPPEVLLYTFAVGPVIFEKFGHSALCLDYHGEYDTVCFNYGVTDFGAGARLVWGFLRSKQKFWVEPVPLRNLVWFYAKKEDRSIWKQALPLTPEQVTAIEDHLWGDLDESRRYYYYDHFYDNCTTRLRDIIDQATGGALKRDSGSLYPVTFRDLGRRGMSEFPPLLVFSDFLVGRDLDHNPDLWEAMFLPDILREEVERRMGAKAEVVNLRKGPPFPTSGPSGRPWVIAFALLFALPLALARLAGRLERVALGWALVPLVFFGVLIWSLIALSSIPALRWNEVALLFVPFDLAIPFLSAPRRRWYARVRVGIVLLVSLLAAIGVFKQPLWVPALVAFLPLAQLAFDWPPRRARVEDRSASGAATASRSAA